MANQRPVSGHSLGVATRFNAPFEARTNPERLGWPGRSASQPADTCVMAEFGHCTSSR